jgi:hypothetical protein
LLRQSTQLYVQRSMTHLHQRNLEQAWREANLARFQTALGAFTDAQQRVTIINAPATGRGLDNYFARMPISPGLAVPTEAQTFSNDSNLRSPYTERWSWGFQRQLPGKTLLDASYVGTVSHKLTTRTDFIPITSSIILAEASVSDLFLRSSSITFRMSPVAPASNAFRSPWLAAHRDDWRAASALA